MTGYSNEHVELAEDFAGLLTVMSRDELVRLMTFLSYHADLCLAVLEQRFGIEVDEDTGAPVIPYELPDGLDVPDTVLTRAVAGEVQH